MIDYRDVCLKVCDIAREAGEYIASQRSELNSSHIEFKGAQNMVTYVDKQAEAMIVSALSKLLYGAGYITEEGTATASDEYLKWIIDPLDGTTNYIHGLPPYCVSIALMEGDQIVLGVVYEITLGEIFYAWRGSEAYHNGIKTHVSKVEKLENALIGIGFSYSTITYTEDFLESIVYLQKNTNGIRRLGSATADIIYVACGRFDAFCQVKLSAWDVAAAAFIAKAAGATVTDYKGGGDYIFGGEIIVANPYIYDEFREKVV